HGDGSNQHKSKGAPGAPLQKTTESIAKESGISERTLQENKQLARNLVPEAKEAVREKAIPKKDALAMSRLAPEKQREIVAKNDKKAIRTEVASKNLPSSRRKTVAKEPEPEGKFIQVEKRWKKDIALLTDWWDKMPTAYQQLTGGETLTGCMQVPVPFHHNMMLAMFRKMCDDAGDAGDELRESLIAEVKLLAERIDELND
ncbi:MAG: hypothetical protein LBI05_03965, partial [Planctomycetaceae bacterium]|nr:hypothetical protein [Planctomycetaceae bacterium]